MKPQRVFPFLVGIVLCLVMVSSYWDAAFAQTETNTIRKKLVARKPLDVSLGQAGVYFPNSEFTGSVELTRIDSVHTNQLKFTQRWIEIKLYDRSNQLVEKTDGLGYLYFILNIDERDAWKKDKLGLFRYNEIEKIWEACNSLLITDKKAPYGRLTVRVSGNYQVYGLAIKQ